MLIRSLSDIQDGMNRVEAVSNILINYIVTSADEEPVKTDTICYTIMVMRDIAQHYAKQIDDLSVTNVISPISH